MIIAILPLVLAGTWTVDADGPPADFHTIQAAIDSPLVADGDVLLVQPGTYDELVLDRPLTIVGPGGGPRPLVVQPATVQGASSFTLAGLELSRLTVSGVSGRGRIDDCFLTGTWEVAPTLQFFSCAQVEVTRTEVRGHDGEFDDWPWPAASIDASRAMIVDCVVRGGDGFTSSAGETGGGNALHLSGGSDVVVVGSSLIGGEEGCDIHACWPGGIAVYTSDASDRVAVRGSSNDIVRGGSTLVTQGASFFGSGTMSYSGVLPDPPPAPGVAAQIPDEPWLAMGGGPDVPGGSRELRVFGPAGTVAGVIGSLAPALTPLSGFGGELAWLDLGLLFETTALVCQGPDVAATKSYALPPSASLAGFTVLFQGALLPIGGTPFVTNVSNVVLRF